MRSISRLDYHWLGLKQGAEAHHNSGRRARIHEFPYHSHDRTPCSCDPLLGSGPLSPGTRHARQDFG